MSLCATAFASVTPHPGASLPFLLAAKSPDGHVGFNDWRGPVCKRTGGKGQLKVKVERTSRHKGIDPSLFPYTYVLLIIAMRLEAP